MSILLICNQTLSPLGAAGEGADGSKQMSMATVDTALDDVRPYLMADGGNVTVVEVAEGIVRLRLEVCTYVQLQLRFPLRGYAALLDGSLQARTWQGGSNWRHAASASYLICPWLAACPLGGISAHCLSTGPAPHFFALMASHPAMPGIALAVWSNWCRC